MAPQNVARIQQSSGIHALLLTAYILASVVGFGSAVFAPWFQWGFLLILMLAMAGISIVIKSDRKRITTVDIGVYGRQRNTTHEWVLFVPFVAIIMVAGSPLVRFVYGLVIAQ